MTETGVRQTALRARLVEQAADLTVRVGWGAVTMARLADEVGVSRQTVYNEVGGKPALAEAMVLRELGRFLDLVSLSFGAADDLVEGVRLAAAAVLEQAAANPLLRAVLASSHGSQTDLLPLLTTRSESLLTAAREGLRAELTAYDVGLDEARRDTVVDTVVRLVLSHVTAPGGRAEDTAAGIAWVVGRVLGSGAR